MATKSELSAAERKTLCDVAERTAHALAEAGYFGPFGIDAFRWRDEGGVLHFNPRSDLNARYSMGWHVGMGDWRPDVTPDRAE
jgi:hypothetical protein